MWLTNSSQWQPSCIPVLDALMDDGDSNSNHFMYGKITKMVHSNGKLHIFVLRAAALVHTFALRDHGEKEKG